jgi:hypothetical protein
MRRFIHTLNAITKGRHDMNSRTGLAILSILILSNTASACVNPTNSFATEVLLNKPGVSYNLSGMIESDDVIVKMKEVPVGAPDTPEPQMVVINRNVTTIDPKPVETRTELDAIVYRSHHNPDVAVILSEDQIPINGEWNDVKHLSIRIQIPTKEVHRSMPIVQIELTGNMSIADIDLNASAEYGWGVTEHGREGAYTLEKDNIHINVYPEVRYPPILDEEDLNLSPEELKSIKERYQEMELRGEITPTTHVSIAIENAETLEVREIDNERCNWQPPGMDILGGCEMVVGYYYDKRYGCTCLSGCVTPAGIPFDSPEECEAVCGRGAGDEIAEFLVAIGFFDDREEALSEIGNWEQKTSEWNNLEPAIDTSGFDCVTALLVELDWLSENRVIENLTERDIHGMCKVAHQGTAGFNSRIVYEDGVWIAYRETENPVQLVKLADCGGFSITELPGGLAQSTPTASTTHAPAPDRTPTPTVPAFTAFAVIAGVLAVAYVRGRRRR